MEFTFCSLFSFLKRDKETEKRLKMYLHIMRGGTGLRAKRIHKKKAMNFIIHHLQVNEWYEAAEQSIHG